ncbi:MAG TPA: DUF2905 domain-containing protein [Anaerolineales bacterium]|nr:DUF2905 domain-containing protein [Anaerolineales bacterium]
MENLAKYLVIGGVILILIGGGVYLASKFGLPLGHLPGDFHMDNGSFKFYFPLASSILISVILTILLNLLARLFRK